MPSFTVFKGSEDGSITKAVTSKPELTGDQVYLRVTASGVCGTDLHYRNAGMVLGHEGVGIIEEIGPGCRYMKKGDRVGWGYEHDSCSHCQKCLSGNEIYCPERAIYGEVDFDQGSFAEGAVWREAFLFKIPDNLSDEAAAPLQCGGATVFNALHSSEAQPTETVGVMGVGGLGHLAIQFASKMGFSVVVLSSSDAKKEEAERLGANEYIATKGVRELKVSRPIDRLIVTTSAQPDWEQIIPIMAPNATIHPLGASRDNFSIPYMPMLCWGLRIHGSLVASKYIHQQMLDFAAQHGIKPIIEKFPMTEQGAKEALDKLSDGSMRYRGVLIPEGAPATNGA